MKAHINGKELSFEPNETILEVARKNGIFIPTLCELADIDHTPGTCRVEHRDVAPGQFRFTMDMHHPLWGHTFHQSGVFNDPQI